MEDLLKPRYKVIAIYPQSKMKVGEIIIPDRLDGTANGFWVTTDKDDRKLIYATVENYPHLFRKMDWWEDRKTEEMPEYVKDKENHSILYKAYGWLQNCAMFYFAPDETSITPTEYFIPATLSDLEQITNKK